MKPGPPPIRPPITTRLLPIARRLWPALETLSGKELVNGVADVFGLLYSAPPALAGIGWLIAVTDLTLIRSRWPALLLLLALVAILDKLGFVFFIEVRPGEYGDFSESLATIIAWSAALLFGPTAVWVAVLWSLINYGYRYGRASSARLRWNVARNFSLALISVPAGLVALALYRRWGGVFPLPGLALDRLLPALGATGVQFVVLRLFWLPLLLYFGSALAVGSSSRGMNRFLVTVMALPGLIDPFAVLAAALYTRMGLGAYLFFVCGLIVTSLLTRRLGKFAVRSRQRSRELEMLEQLGRAIIEAPPDGSTLSDVLAEHVTGMFSAEWVEICIFPDQVVYGHPPGRPPVAAPVWQWLATTAEARGFLPGAAPPWDGASGQDALVVAPILDVESGEPIGGVCLAPRHKVEDVANSLPAVQSLAAQVASALHRAEIYRVEQELALAGRIQASFLPRDLPDVEGWQVAAVLEPARQTSGDFYDFIPLPNERLGIVIADVADKGTGAALYMALSRTLIRSYAFQYHARPDYVLRVANRRILMDTDADLFVTVFYGILDPRTGTLVYCNAGHNPPFILSAQNKGQVEKLGRTGIPLGIFEGETWEQCSVRLAPGDMLWLYTDGVTDAENGNGDFFGEQRLLQVAQASLGHSAQEAQHALMTAVHRFVGAAPQFDDIALTVIARKPKT